MAILVQCCSCLSLCVRVLCFSPGGTPWVCVQWFFPTLFVLRARRECQQRLARQGTPPLRRVGSSNSDVAGAGILGDDSTTADNNNNNNNDDDDSGYHHAPPRRLYHHQQLQVHHAQTKGTPEAQAAAYLKAVNPYTSRCHCTAFAVFVLVWSAISVAFGFHHLFSVRSFGGWPNFCFDDGRACVRSFVRVRLNECHGRNR